jgi:hypothetical protein
MTGKNPIVTMSQFCREVSKAIARLSYAEKVAMRMAISLRTKGLRERVLN